MSGAELERRTRERSARATVLANVLGGVIVFAFLAFLLPFLYFLAAGRMSPRIHDGSPVMWTRLTSSVGMLTSSRKAAMASSESVKGWPA